MTSVTESFSCSPIALLTCSRHWALALVSAFFVLTGRIPALGRAVPGSSKHGCVVSPLFSALGRKPLATRLKLGEGAVRVITDGLYERKEAKIRAQLSALRHGLPISDGGLPTDTAGTHNPGHLMARGTRYR